jgi:hypothetical protein
MRSQRPRCAYSAIVHTAVQLFANVTYRCKSESDDPAQRNVTEACDLENNRGDVSDMRDPDVTDNA